MLGGLGVMRLRDVREHTRHHGGCSILRLLKRVPIETQLRDDRPQGAQLQILWTPIRHGGDLP